MCVPACQVASAVDTIQRKVDLVKAIEAPAAHADLNPASELAGAKVLICLTCSARVMDVSAWHACRYQMHGEARWMQAKN